MKALIIENEYDVDNSIKAFLKDNPTLFTEINEQTFCKERPMEDLARFIPAADAIIIATTFMYKDQVEEYMDAFLTGPLKNKKIKFYVYSYYRHVNEWKNTIWDEEKTLRAKTIELMKSGNEVFSFGEYGDSSEEDIVDRFNILGENRRRGRYYALPLQYSEEHDVFFIDHKYYNLEESIEDYNNNKKS